MATLNKPTVVGTLSTQGYVTEPLVAIDFLLAHFMETQPSQYTALVNVRSFQEIIDNNLDNFGQMGQQLKESLFQYLLTAFSNIEMEVVVKPIDGDPHSSYWDIEIQCNFSDYTGKKYSLGRAINMYGKMYQRLSVLNRTGELK